MKRSTLALVDSEEQARATVERLTSSGFSQDDISVLFADKSSTREFAHEKETKLPEGATIGAGTGGTLGGIVGLMAGLGSLAIPGLGPFIAAGPVMAALSGGAIGAGIGGIAGALIGLGVPEYEAKRYQGAVKEGGVLISVHTDSADRAKQAKRIFEESGAHDISTTNESRGGDRAADERNADVSVARTQETGASTGTGQTGDVISARTGGAETVIPGAPAQDVLGPQGGTTPITGAGISHLRQTASEDNPRREDPSVS
jgi:Heat induced stress protein YflT domain